MFKSIFFSGSAGSDENPEGGDSEAVDDEEEVGDEEADGEENGEAAATEATEENGHAKDTNGNVRVSQSSPFNRSFQDRKRVSDVHEDEGEDEAPAVKKLKADEEVRLVDSRSNHAHRGRGFLSI